MNIKPRSDVVIIRPYKQIVSRGGVIIPRDADQFHEDVGEIVACGPGRIHDNGYQEPMTVKPGDMVLFSTNGHQVTTLEGEELIVLRQESIIGVLPDHPKKQQAAANG